jgi:tetratricopeptide (TPR) repeat protein
VADLGKRDDLTPVAEAYKAWAEGELNLALQNADVALEKAAEAEKKLGRPFAPFLDLKARAHAAKGQTAEAIAAYEAGIAATPKYRGLRWDLAKLKSRLKDDSALDLVAALEKDEPGTVGPEYEVFRGDHYLRQGKLEEAKAAYTKAADLGSDAEILLGIARVTFEEERKKGTKADIDAVGTAFEEGFSARRVFPELNEAMGDVNLWNFQVGAADKAFQDAEDQYKKLKRPVGDLVQFFDRVIATFAKADDKQIKKEAEKATEDWKKRKADYLASVLAGTN